MVSGGRYAATSTSRLSRSRTALLYSARFRRWNGRDPGLGFAAASLSIRDSNDDTIAVITAASGRRAPAGGIMPARSLRMIFSVSAGSCTSFAASKPASDRSPALPRSLWQVAQYCLTTAVCSAAVIAVGVAACAATGLACAGIPVLGVTACCAETVTHQPQTATPRA